ncbi:hypothetical protein NDU88_010800 [Pleurodeles waltl]|uniref:DUF4371 domain-containing protein n=1 Tax=Pleurodeles waltl TaxID=8319 RepID=A0AAV7RZ80_PLEWA|nr:hypothetical protein NDU88_010800 [Pleurodeles waltl]
MPKRSERSRRVSTQKRTERSRKTSTRRERSRRASTTKRNVKENQHTQKKRNVKENQHTKEKRKMKENQHTEKKRNVKENQHTQKKRNVKENQHTQKKRNVKEKQHTQKKRNVKENEHTKEKRKVKENQHTQKNKNVKENQHTQKKRNVKENQHTQKNKNVKENQHTQKKRNVKENQHTQKKKNVKENQHTQKKSNVKENQHTQKKRNVKENQHSKEKRKHRHSSTEKAITRQGAEESSCKQVCCQIEDPARSHQAGQDSVRLSSDIKFQQLDPRAIQKQSAAASGLFPGSGHNNLTDQFHCVGPHETLRTGKVVGVRHQVATWPNSVYVVKMSLLKWLHKDSASQVELEGTTANDITTAVMECLHKHGFHEDFLRECLIALACDGASVMLGKQAGVAAQLQIRYPGLFVWHCSNHRLELAVGDVMKEISGINHFQIFFDKLYSLYHASPKNQRD